MTNFAGTFFVFLFCYFPKFFNYLIGVPMLSIFSIFDSKAEAWLLPFFCVNRAVAMRDFAHAAMSQGSAFNRNASDYTLFEIGEWDPHTGTVTMSDIKCSLGTALELSSAEEGGS